MRYVLTKQMLKGEAEEKVGRRGWEGEGGKERVGKRGWEREGGKERVGKRGWENPHGMQFIL
jgi:hypothetical protein